MYRSRIRSIAAVIAIALLATLVGACGSEPEPVVEQS